MDIQSMENQGSNPLSKYFRQPAIYLKLPSQGRWWTANSLDLPSNQEVAIYPMSAKDEILLKTPDALLNGQGVVDVIHSCCPCVKNAWAMPSVDIDAVLISIRIATYGNRMDFNSDCPHCNHKNMHEIDLGTILSQINCPAFNEPVIYHDLEIKLKPQSYLSMNRNNMIRFHEDKIIMALNNTELDPDQKASHLAEAVEKLVEIGINSCTDSTEYIELQDGTRVSQSDHIHEFYKNAESEVIKAMQAKIEELSIQAQPKTLELSCENCGETYKTNLLFDYSNFFGKGF